MRQRVATLALFLALAFMASASTFTQDTVVLSSGSSSHTECEQISGGQTRCFHSGSSELNQAYTRHQSADYTDTPGGADLSNWYLVEDYQDTQRFTTSESGMSITGSNTGRNDSDVSEFVFHDATYSSVYSIPSERYFRIFGGREQWFTTSSRFGSTTWDCTGVVSGSCAGTSDFTQTNGGGYLGGTYWWTTIIGGEVVSYGKGVWLSYPFDSFQSREITSWPATNNVPEPSTMLLTGCALLGAGLIGRRRTG